MASLLGLSRINLVLLVFVVASALSCKRKDVSGETTELTAASASADALPPLKLNDETTDLLLTWVDDAGDFHVVQKIAEIPSERREQVRVVVTTSDVGTGQFVYVADLRQKAADGNYPVHAMPRAAWDNIGADRRKTRMEERDPGAIAAAVASAQPPAEKFDGKHLRATIYGAEWCKPCHDAESFLRGLGVDVTKKDIEQSDAAQAEMRQKLARVNRHGASIPVIDLLGQIFVGFNADALKQVVDQAKQRRPETL